MVIWSSNNVIHLLKSEQAKVAREIDTTGVVEAGLDSSASARATILTYSSILALYRIWFQRVRERWSIISRTRLHPSLEWEEPE